MDSTPYKSAITLEDEVAGNFEAEMQRFTSKCKDLLDDSVRLSREIVAAEHLVNLFASLRSELDFFLNECREYNRNFVAQFDSESAVDIPPCPQPEFEEKPDVDALGCFSGANADAASLPENELPSAVKLRIRLRPRKIRQRCNQIAKRGLGAIIRKRGRPRKSFFGWPKELKLPYLDLISPKKIRRPRKSNAEGAEAGLHCRRIKIKRPRHYECEECGTVLVTKLDFEKHKALHDRQRTYTCARCANYQGTSHHAIQIHLRRAQCITIRSYQCDICGRVLKNSSNLAEHMWSFHPPVPQEQPAFTCEFCGAGLKTMRSYKKHTRNHFAERTLSCEQCAFRCRTGWQLKNHMHSHSSEKMVPCEFEGCNSTFKTKIYMRTHMKSVHKNASASYVCDLCKQPFVSAHEFKRHVMSHTGQKPYSCPHCARAFSSAQHVKDHIVAVHKMELDPNLELPANIPPDPSIVRNLLSSVQEIVAKEAPLPRPHCCEFCGLTFTRKYGMKTHVRKVHKDLFSSESDIKDDPTSSNATEDADAAETTKLPVEQQQQGQAYVLPIGAGIHEEIAITDSTTPVSTSASTSVLVSASSCLLPTISLPSASDVLTYYKPNVFAEPVGYHYEPFHEQAWTNRTMPNHQ